MEKKEMDRYRCLKETCGRLGKLFGEIAEALQGVASMEQATAPLAKVTEEDMLRNCISMLMQERDARGRYLVSSKCQWQAIYRILADHGLGVADGDYAGFERLAWRIQPAGCRVPFSLSALKQITKTGFTRPFSRWTFDPAYSKTRRPYDEMVAIATRFSEILECHLEAGEPQACLTTPVPASPWG
jgi:hypothetical protein